MASCNPNDPLSFDEVVMGGGRHGVVSTTGDAGGSSFTTSGEGRGRGTEVVGGSGEMEFPGVGSCERSSVTWDGASAIGAAASRDLRLGWRSCALHHMRTWTGFASRIVAQASQGILALGLSAMSSV